ncbi:MAG: NAD-dependent epimerase/dehydratase family protein [Deltaproteobacteria bacterium]|nr:NAD-dependent epimerase/dehydratase family protein [Deltaproteobacteria bacterium]
MSEITNKRGQENPVILITGGAGFLGRALVRELQKQSGPEALIPKEIRVFDTQSGNFESLDRVCQIIGDVRSPDSLRQACQGVDLVIHSAAVIDWGPHSADLVESVNLKGTENVIQAASRAGVRSLVFTSTEDVVYDGRPVVDGDESLPYPAKFINAYGRTKATAEQKVLQSNGRHLKTVALRSCGMYGEGDPFHVGSLLKMARRNMCFRVGNGRAHCQQVYVGNVAHAHVLAARALLTGQNQIAGQAYFVTDDPAQNFFDFLEPIIEGIGYNIHPWKLSIPKPAMYSLGCLAELLAYLLGPIYRFTPTISRFGVGYVTHDFTFSSAKATRDFGYQPVYSKDQAFARTIAYFKEHPHAKER